MFYPVDNTLSDGKGKVDPNVKRLKVVIEDAAKRDLCVFKHDLTSLVDARIGQTFVLSRTTYFVRVSLQDTSRIKRVHRYSYCVRCKTATRICVECGVPLRDVEKCMHTLHERGALLFWRDNDTLRNVVVTNPKWLIEKISAVIRTRKAGSQKRRWNRQLREKFHGLSRATTKIQALYGLRQRRSTLSNEGATMQRVYERNDFT